MYGTFSPSSILTFFIVPTALSIMSFPTPVEPVKLTFFTRGCVYSSVTALRSFIVTTWIIFGGMPAYIARAVSARVYSSVLLGGFITTIYPAAIIGTSFHIIIVMGKFQGVIIL
jgi:hypothetical protein